MLCKICDGNENIEILNKNAIPIWTGGDNSIENCFYPSILYQCIVCGHVYEYVSDKLDKELTKIYSSSHAQASTPPGSGNWGLKRAEMFLNKINYLNYNSAIEIGCADGFFLQFLEKNNYIKLIGIEPSLPNCEKVGNIEFINNFVDENTYLNCKVDLIYSNAVFEHIENIVGVLRFVKNHLNENGELFFAVPNAQLELTNGDPALFIHEHVHYYTQDSIKYLLQDNGFNIQSIISECDALYVSAKLNHKKILKHSISYNPFLYRNYKLMLTKKLETFKDLMTKKDNVLIHGANNKLNNILGWIDENFSFTLADNDEKKIGKSFFGHIVQKPSGIRLEEYSCIIVVPTCFKNQIKNEYKELGFTKDIYFI